MLTFVPYPQFNLRFGCGLPVLPAGECVFEGKDAVMALLKGLYVLYDEVRSVLYPIQADVFRPNIGKEEQVAKLEIIIKKTLRDIKGTS